MHYTAKKIKTILFFRVSELREWDRNTFHRPPAPPLRPHQPVISLTASKIFPSCLEYFPTHYSPNLIPLPPASNLSPIFHFSSLHLFQTTPGFLNGARSALPSQRLHVLLKPGLLTDTSSRSIRSESETVNMLHVIIRCVRWRRAGLVNHGFGSSREFLLAC